MVLIAEDDSPANPPGAKSHAVGLPAHVMHDPNMSVRRAFGVPDN